MSRTDLNFSPTGLLLDLDGTLIDSSSRFTERVAAAVRKAAARVPVAIVSGREPDDVVRFARMLGLTCPQVADNGARIVDPVSGATIQDFPMDALDARRIVGCIEERHLAYYAVDEGRVARRQSEFSSWRVTVVAAHAAQRDTCFQILEDLRCAAVEGVPSTDATGDFWYANFSRSGVNKGSGARYFAGLAGIDISGIVAIGDSHNDLAMFSEVGLAVAMGHAHTEIRAAAAHVVNGIADDGVAQAIDLFVLRPLGTNL